MTSVHDAISAALKEAREPLSLRQVHAAIGPVTADVTRQAHVIYLAASERADLVAQIAELKRRVQSSPDQSLPVVAHQARGSAPAESNYRLAIVAQECGELIGKLELAERKIAAPACDRLRTPNGIYFRAGASRNRIAIVFPGQGSQFPRMLEQVCLWSARARDWFNALDDAYEAAGLRPATCLLYPHGEGSQTDAGLFGLEQGAQLSLAASLALYEIVCGLGVQADVLVGHSNGEHAALIAAGAFSFPDLSSACRNLCRGGLLLSKLPAPREAETVAAISNIDRGQLATILEAHRDDLFLAMDNAPSQLVLSGRTHAIQSAIRSAEKLGAIAVPLAFDRAWHTPLFEDAANVLSDYYAGLPIAAPRVPVYSCLDGDRFPDDPEQIRRRTSRQWVAPVFFHQTISKLYEEGVRLFIEVGPGNKLTGFVDDVLRGRPHLAVSASSRTRPDLSQLQLLAAELFVNGAAPPVDVLEIVRSATGAREFTRGHPASRIAGNAGVNGNASASRASEVVMASHKNLLAEIHSSRLRVQRLLEGMASPVAAVAQATASRSGAFLTNERRISNASAVFDCRLDLNRHPLLAHHSFGRGVSSALPHRLPLAVVPFTMSLELLAEAAVRNVRGTARAIRNIRANHWLALDHGTLEVQIETERKPDENGEVVVAARIVQAVAGERRVAFEGDVSIGKGNARGTRATALPGGSQVGPPHWTAADFYRQFAFHGPCFQGLDKIISVAQDSIDAELKVTRLAGIETSDLQLDPALLDCAGQLAAFWLLEQGERQFGIFPFWAETYSLYGRTLAPGDKLRCRGTVRRAASDSTQARFEFTSVDGALVAVVEGLRQRMIRFPKALAEIMVRPAQEVFLSDEPGSDAFEGCATIRSEDWRLLQLHGGIWARAIAHLVLDDRELEQWRQGAIAGERVSWLLSRIAVKEAVRRCWFGDAGSLSSADIGVEIHSSGMVRVFDCRGIELPVHVSLQVDEDVFLAVARRRDCQPFVIEGESNSLAKGSYQ